MLKDASSDLETDTLQFWIQEVFETNDLDWITHYAPNVPVWAIAELEAKIDNDIIAKSWIDFKWLQLSPDETAEKTRTKNASSRKRINKNLKDNAYNFYRRLWELRIKNIQQIHSYKEKRIPIEWWSINNKWIFISDEAWWYGSALIWANFVKWDLLVMPIIETMIWDNDQRRKDNLSIFMQLTWWLAWDDWKPVVKWTQFLKLACDEYWYDYEKFIHS